MEELNPGKKILCLPSIYQFERKLGFWTTLLYHQHCVSIAGHLQLIWLIYRLLRKSVPLLVINPKVIESTYLLTIAC